MLFYCSCIVQADECAIFHIGLGMQYLPMSCEKWLPAILMDNQNHQYQIKWIWIISQLWLHRRSMSASWYVSVDVINSNIIGTMTATRWTFKLTNFDIASTWKMHCCTPMSIIRCTTCNLPNYPSRPALLSSPINNDGISRQNSHSIRISAANMTERSAQSRRIINCWIG